MYKIEFKRSDADAVHTSRYARSEAYAYADYLIKQAMCDGVCAYVSVCDGYTTDITTVDGEGTINQDTMVA